MLMLFRNISIVSAAAANGEDKCRVQRGYSWRLSRPSLRRKPKQRTGSDSDAVVLNNGRDHAVCNGKKSYRMKIYVACYHIKKVTTIHRVLYYSITDVLLTI